MAKQAQKWFLTINNPKDHGIDHEQIKLILASKENCLYWCMADEIGNETQTYHTHLFLYFRNEVKFTTIKNLFPAANIRSCYGTCQQNRDYITKSGKWETTEKKETSVDGSFEEFGELPQEQGQGFRSDNEPATWKAFLRRIHHVIEYHADGTTTDHGSATDYIFPPPPPVPDWVTEIENAKQTEFEDLPFP